MRITELTKRSRVLALRSASTKISTQLDFGATPDDMLMTDEEFEAYGIAVLYAGKVIDKLADKLAITLRDTTPQAKEGVK